LNGRQGGQKHPYDGGPWAEGKSIPAKNQAISHNYFVVLVDPNCFSDGNLVLAKIVFL
jgi:hypothetical protein